MRSLKLILIILLSVAFVLSACTTPEDQTTEVPNQIEELREPDDRSDLIEQEPGFLFKNTELIVMIKQELESEGWSDLETIEGEPDSSKRWGSLALEPTYLEEGAVLYSIIGHVKNDYYNSVMDYTIIDQHISVVVKIIFYKDNSEGEIIEVFYVSDSGRTLSGTHLENILNSHVDPDIFLAADDEDLWSLMCAY